MSIAHNNGGPANASGLDAIPSPRLSIVGEEFKLKVLFVDDDQFALRLIADGLRSQLEVATESNTADALERLTTFEANVVVTDLDLGGGPDGVRLLQRVEQLYPWIGRVVLTAHTSPLLAVGHGDEIPHGAVYLVKSKIGSLDEVVQAVTSSLAGGQVPQSRDSRAEESIQTAACGDDRIEVSAGQAVVLRYVAAGLSNAAIAQEMGLSQRAAERVVQRAFQALGIDGDDLNPRVVTVGLLKSGRVYVR
jgi:DNA-binding NarL/FixJ family response regulator